MPRTCTICSHTDKEAINQELVNGTAFRHIAARFDISTGALQRHKKEHLPASLARAKEAEEIAGADGLLDQVVGLQAKALVILEKAEKDNDLRTALMAVREARATMELVAKITGELVHKQETRLKTDVQWTFVIGEGYVDNDEWEARQAWEKEWKAKRAEAAGQSPRVINGHTVGELPPG